MGVEFELIFLAFIHVGSRKVWVSPVTYHPNGDWVLQQGRNLLMWLDEMGLRATHLIHDRDTKFTDAFDALLEKSFGIDVVKSATYHPNGEWVLQQGRNLSMWLEELGLEATHLIHDRDTKFTAGFDTLFEHSAGIDVLKSPVRAPNANAFAESWIATVKRECLDYFACFSLRHADHIVQAFVAFYSDHRPHQSLDNRTLDSADKPSIGSAQSPPIAGKITCRSELGGLLKHYYRSAA